MKVKTILLTFDDYNGDKTIAANINHTLLINDITSENLIDIKFLNNEHNVKILIIYKCI